MKLQIKNFGPIEEGEIDLSKKIYIFVGYNNADAWDGTWYTNGQEVADGTYFYVLSLDPSNDKLKYSGYIEVRR